MIRVTKHRELRNEGAFCIYKILIFGLVIYSATCQIRGAVDARVGTEARLAFEKAVLEILERKEKADEEKRLHLFVDIMNVAFPRHQSPQPVAGQQPKHSNGE